MEAEQFDATVTSTFRGAAIDYGIVHGDATVLLVKAGQNGSMYGYRNKYLHIARNVNGRFGFTVVCSSNPFDGSDSLSDAMALIGSYAAERGFADWRVYFMGHSNGALLGLWYGWRYERIRRMLLVNGPLMRNPHLAADGMRRFAGEMMTLVYADNDPSFDMAGRLAQIEDVRARMVYVRNTDHDFSNAPQMFASLPETYLCVP